MAKWTETQTAIQISNGIFQVQLGSVTPLNLPFDESYWISIEINTDGEMSPRTRLASVPYARNAEYGLTVGTGANNLVQLDGSAKLPAVDGSQLTGIATGSRIAMITKTGLSH